MAETVTFELVSPEKILLSRPVEMVVIPGSEGDFGVLPGHAPLIASVRPGVIEIYQGGSVAERIFTTGGFAEVTGTRCTMLADEAVHLDALDRAAAEAELASLRGPEAAAGAAGSAATVERRRRVAAARIEALDRFGSETGRAPAAH